jgi:HAD superfamily hydrolase (TIGR01549 family)
VSALQTVSTADVVIFDYDDTIVAARDCRRRALLAVMQAAGVTADTGGFEEAYGQSFRELVRALSPEIDFESFLASYLAYIQSHPAKLLPGVRDMVQALHGRRVLAAIVSSSDSRLIRAELGAHGLADAFASVSGTDSSGPRKPDPRALPAAARSLLPRHGHPKIVYIGDSLLDYRMSVEASCPFIAVCTGRESKEDFVAVGLQPEDVVGDLTMILSRLNA